MTPDPLAHSNRDLGAEPREGDADEIPLASPVDGEAQSADAPVSARAVMFCNRCGTRLVSKDAQCPRCVSAAKPTTGASTSETLAAGEDEISHVKWAVGLYFALLAISLVLTIYSLAAQDDSGPEAEVVASVGFALLTIGWAVASRKTLMPVLKRIGPWWTYAAAPVFAVCTFIIASLVVSTLNNLFHTPTVNYLDDLAVAGYGFGFAVLLVCVQPGIIEELAFRGVMTSALDRVMTLRESSIVVSFLFGILHLSIPSLAHLTLLGLLLAWLRRKAGSLYPCMLMHFTHNLLVLLDERYGWTPW